jgi:hypothetical protein
VDAQLLGSHVELMPSRQRRDGTQHAGRDVEDALFVDDLAWRHRMSSLLNKGTSKLVVSSGQQGFTYMDSVAMQGGENLTVQSKSVDPRLMKQVEEQKAILRAASQASRAFDGEAGAQELGAVRQSSRVMKDYWLGKAAGTATPEARVDGKGQETRDEELQELQGSAEKMKRFWRAVEARKLGDEASDSASSRQRGPGMYVVQDMALSADVGLHGGVSPAKASLVVRETTSPESREEPSSQSPRVASSAPQDQASFKVLKPFSSANPAILDVREGERLSQNTRASAGRHASLNLVGQSTSTRSTLAKEAEVQMGLLRAHLARDAEGAWNESEGFSRQPVASSGARGDNHASSLQAPPTAPSLAAGVPHPQPASAQLKPEGESMSCKDAALEEGADLAEHLQVVAAVGGQSLDEILKNKNGVVEEGEQFMRVVMPDEAGLASQSRGETHVQIADPGVLVSDVPDAAHVSSTPREQKEDVELDEDEASSTDIDVCV